MGGFLALLAAATFAFNNALARRGVLTGSVIQAMSISVPLGVPIFLAAAIATGAFSHLSGFSPLSVAYLCGAGIVHFVWGRYCNYRAVKAVGANLAGPLTEASVLVALSLAVFLLGETLTPLKIIGIVLVLSGPLLAVERRIPASGKEAHNTFKPMYREGFTFALLAATGYGVSPILVRLALGHASWQASVAAGLVSYSAAAVVVVTIILVTGNLHHVRSVSPATAKWFGLAGLFVGLSQMLRYMALSIAPVTVVTPIQRLSLLFRLVFSLMMNRDHEVFSSRMVLGTIVSLAGALLLSMTTDTMQHALGVPAWLEPLFNWNWL